MQGAAQCVDGIVAKLSIRIKRSAVLHKGFSSDRSVRSLPGTTSPAQRSTRHCNRALGPHSMLNNTSQAPSEIDRTKPLRNYAASRSPQLCQVKKKPSCTQVCQALRNCLMTATNISYTPQGPLTVSHTQALCSPIMPLLKDARETEVRETEVPFQLEETQPLGAPRGFHKMNFQENHFCFLAV